MKVKSVAKTGRHHKSNKGMVAWFSKKVLVSTSIPWFPLQEIFEQVSRESGRGLAQTGRGLCPRNGLDCAET